MHIRYRVAAISFALVLFGAGCTIGAQKQAPPTGGMWYSPDRGMSWKQISVVYTSDGVGSWSNTDVVTTVIDPSDSNSIYAGTRDNGLFYTYDSGKTWMQPKDLAAGAVQAVAVHPKDKCTIYVGRFAEIWKSEDCSRSYKRVFSPELADGDFLKIISIDWYSPNLMYAATQNGVLFKSSNGGATWKTSHRFENRLSSLFVDPHDSRVLVAGLDGNGIEKSIDAGETWVNLKENTKKIDGSMNVKLIVAAKSTPNLYIAATDKGLIRTLDGGVNFEDIKILTVPPNISALTIDPKNSGVIYYGTDKVFYRSSNGGANWETIRLPTARAAGTLLVHPEISEAIYMGAKNLMR